MAMCILLTVMMVSQVNTRGEIEKSYTSKCEFYCIWIIFQKKKKLLKLVVSNTVTVRRPQELQDFARVLHLTRALSPIF